MKNKKGFTLTEILLAVMIVGVVGVTLAAMSTAASRESGVGKNKMILRENLTVAMRQLRQDLASAHQVLYVQGPLASANGPSQPKLLLKLNIGSNFEGHHIPGSVGANPRNIYYCFVPGGVKERGPWKVFPGNGNAAVANDDGVIYRGVLGRNDPNYSNYTCIGVENNALFSPWLSHVKFISSSTNMFGVGTYPVPLFAVVGQEDSSYTKGDDNRTNLGTQIKVNLIVEILSSPLVNDAVEEVFVTGNGFREPEA